MSKFLSCKAECQIIRENGGLTLAQGKTISEWWLPLGREKILFRGVENTWVGDNVGPGWPLGGGECGDELLSVKLHSKLKDKKGKSVFWR